MNKFMVKAKDSITDQKGIVRIKKNVEYEVASEFFGVGFLMIDETGEKVLLDKRYFYEIEEF